jgi:hypothetical protein
MRELLGPKLANGNQSLVLVTDNTFSDKNAGFGV